ncbi:hypothetical protein SLS63_013213 [Diaporthe eres]|uniref:polynucleotide adenylyltransferase n=1 Tax=Diaporthe eres TaxID=83184 RepID=A0ABR1NP41_DIAER
MPPKQQPDLAHPLPSRPPPRANPAQQSTSSSTQSISVPSTPHQRPRNFFEESESREPSPTVAQNHSPRSAYSEPNGGAASMPLRPFPKPCQYETASRHFRRRIPYSIGSDRLERRDLDKVKNNLSKDEERKLSTDMRELYDRLLPSAEVEENRKKLVQKLEQIFNDEWPGHEIRVHLFGSSGNLLCSDDSDGGMEQVVCVSTAKVPIVKIWDPELKLACDMNVNNTLALENTRMVRTYVETDERVRPLAMVIKYWTRRRVINDADDLTQLRGFGDKNKSTLGELLFQFFRFYAHEFDYDEMAISVRLGKLIPKKEKNWQVGNGNQNLCVEEPFNRERNLGNTADDWSFRGIHLELRRAFELVAEAKLDECCEQFVQPKEEPTEPKLFTKPTSRPAIIRSSSQQNSGRGGRNGGNRGNRNHFRNGNSSRRASSSNAYDNTQNPGAFPQPGVMPNGLMTQDLQWSQFAQHYPYPENMAMLSNALQMQDRLNWYTHYQLTAHQQAVAHAQRMQTGSTQAGERSRTNSFDQAPPLTAPPRPEHYVWPLHLQPAFYHHHAGYGTYPSSPSAPTAAPEFRRSLHRSSAASEVGGSSSGGTLRSQSQPASRTPAPAVKAVQGSGTPSQVVNGVSNHAPRQSNLIPFPGLASDDRTDSEVEEGSTRTMPDSPPEEDGAGYLGYFVADSSTPPRRTMQAVPPLNDVGLSSINRRRLSTEGPQSVLDRRLQRTSRSPSPLGHGRTFSGTNSAPIASAPFSQSSSRTSKETTPLVVNGSTFMPPSALPSSWVATGDDSGFDNPLRISQAPGANNTMIPEPSTSQSAMASEPGSTGLDRPLVVNGSTQSHILPHSQAQLQSFGQRMAATQGPNGAPYAAFLGDKFQGYGKMSELTRQRLAVRNQQAGISPLDLAIPNPMMPESQHLSPVYENRTPSPTVRRRWENSASHGRVVVPGQAAGCSDDSLREQTTKALHRSLGANGVTNGGDNGPLATTRPNGSALQESAPLRAAKGDFENASGWQKQKSRKKQAEVKTTTKTGPQSEKPPKNDLERKGG